MNVDAVRSDRAFGAMILTCFGALWLEAWCWFAYHGSAALYLLIVAVGAAMFWMALRVYRKNKPAPPAPAPTAEERRASRAFNFINAGQWVAIFIGINILNNIGLGRWDLPLMIAIVGMHFLLLGPLFHRRAHYLTGAALLLLAAAYPFVAPAGLASPVGLLGTGVVLWASALWALRPVSPGSDSR